jgi:hypothetical protein
MTALKRIYFGSSYYDLDAVSSGAKKRAAADLVPRAQSGSYWQRIIALVVLLSISREEAGEIAETIVADDSADSKLRSEALHIVLAFQTKTPATKTALEGLSHEDPVLRRISLAYLAVGSDAVSSIANEEISLNGSLFPSYFGSSSESGKPILPEAPERLDAKTLIPMLKSNDLQTAAYAGYLLTLLDQTEGLMSLINYWEKNGRQESRWTRLVYRAIAYSDESSYAPLLKSIYEKHIDKEGYSRDVQELYWTIRIMSGREIVILRKQIRDEVGMERLR